MCGTKRETHLHFLTCGHYHGIEVERMMKKITTIMEKNGVDPILQHIAVWGIRSALTESQTEMGDFPPGYRALIHQQQRIGWSHLLHARWAIRWHDWLQQYASTQGQAQVDQRKWVRQIISAQWDHAHQRWMRRAKKLEGRQDPEAGPELSERVAALYEKKQHLPRRYHFLFRRTQKDMLGRSIGRIREWMQDTERIVCRAMGQMRRKGRKRTGLEKWLRWERKKKHRRRRITRA